jgi:hypothetical protein
MTPPDRARLFAELRLWKNNVTDLQLVVNDAHRAYVQYLERALGGVIDPDDDVLCELEAAWCRACADRDTAAAHLAQLVAEARRTVVATKNDADIRSIKRGPEDDAA